MFCDDRTKRKIAKYCFIVILSPTVAFKSYFFEDDHYCFKVASSDATNIQAKIEEDGEFYILNGRKWWTSGEPLPICQKKSIFHPEI